MRLIKFGIIALAIIIVSYFAIAQDVITMYNPFTSNFDFVRSSNFSGENITVDKLTALNLSGNLSWINLYSYPVACPAGTFITELGDSVVCSSGGTTSYNQSLNTTDNVQFNSVSSYKYCNNETECITRNIEVISAERVRETIWVT